jgi:hypothetical protein
VRGRRGTAGASGKVLAAITTRPELAASTDNAIVPGWVKAAEAALRGELEGEHWMVELRRVETGPGLVFDVSVAGDAAAPLVRLDVRRPGEPR